MSRKYPTKTGRRRGSVGAPMNGRMGRRPVPRSDPNEIASREKRLIKEMLRDSHEKIQEAEEDAKKRRLADKKFHKAKRKEEEKQRDYFLSITPCLEERIQKLEQEGATNTAKKAKLRRLKRKLIDRNRTRAFTDGTSKFVVERKPTKK